MNALGKILMGVKSICIYVRYKVSYGSRLKINPLNAIRGWVYIELFQGACCSVGKFFMSRGPLYVKRTDNSEIKIGNRCFFNNNCSITAAKKL